MPITIPGEVWLSLSREWLWVYRGPVPKTGEWSAEISVPPGVFFVERGEVRICVDGEEVVVPRGSAFFSASGLRQHWFAKNTVLLSVGFRCTWPDGTPLHRTGLNFVVSATELRLATQELFRRIHRGKKSVGYREAITHKTLTVVDWANHEAAFARWFAIYLKWIQKMGVQPESRTGKSRRRVDQLTAWLNALPFNETTPSLPPHFSLGLRRAEQLLLQHLGIGLRAFLERRRLNAARERILSEQGTLKEIAFALGFRYASHFTAWFRRHTGLSPSAYREGGGVA
jgi:AraC-like DNA-binding protein